MNKKEWLKNSQPNIKAAIIKTQFFHDEELNTCFGFELEENKDTYIFKVQLFDDSSGFCVSNMPEVLISLLVNSYKPDIKDGQKVRLYIQRGDNICCYKFDKDVSQYIHKEDSSLVILPRLRIKEKLIINSNSN